MVDTLLQQFQEDIKPNPTMKNEFIPYEQALALKGLGFDEPCFAFYNERQTLLSDEYMDKAQCIAPLYQQAFRWFRDKKLSDACVCRYQGRDDGGVYYYYNITIDFGIEETRHFKEGFFTHEEAELACLKKLIELLTPTQL